MPGSPQLVCGASEPCSIFGGLALAAGWYGATERFPNELFWYLWGMIAAGLLYDGYAIWLGVRQLAQLAWKWDAPLRTLKRR